MVYYYKAKLLKRSWKKGLFTFLHHGWLIALDIFFRQRHNVFSFDCSEVHKCPRIEVKGLAFQTYKKLSEVDPKLLQAMEQEKRHMDWSTEEWFSRSWRLWIGTIEGQLAIAGWTRTAEQSNDFFFPITSGCALMWQTVTLPAFRGRGLLSAMLGKVLQTLADEGIKYVYGSCRDFNYSSKRGIERAGYCQIGYGIIRRRTGCGIWFPNIKPFSQC